MASRLFRSGRCGAGSCPLGVDRFTAQLSTFAGRADWIADHHPFWYYSGTGMGTTPAVAAAWNRTTLSGVRFLLSGHLHLFQFLGFTETLPNQLIAGDGGTALSQSVKSDFAGLRWMAWGSSPAKASICLVSLRSAVSGMAGISR
jgi:hypothetical protein